VLHSLQAIRYTEVYEVRICVCEYCGNLACADSAGAQHEGKRPVSCEHSAGADGDVILNWVQAGSLAMFRTLQVLRSALRVGRARITNAYDWKFEIARQCQELGGVYVKFLQMLAVHKSTKYLVEGMGAEMAFEQVPYEEIDLRHELGSLAGRAPDH
jgi:hypothetical protein